MGDGLTARLPFRGRSFFTTGFTEMSYTGCQVIPILSIESLVRVVRFLPIVRA